MGKANGRGKVEIPLVSATLREYRFHSDVPLLGPLIVRFRECWNGISTKWYVRALAQQQSEFNLLLLDHMNELEGRLIDQDREGTQLRRDLGELTVQLIAMNRRLASLDERLAELTEK